MLSSVFKGIVQLRNALFTIGALKSARLPAPVISIGNLTVGGTGKTPMTILIAEYLKSTGRKVCVLSRGYGRSKPSQRAIVSDGSAVLVDAAIGGDEPFEIASRFNGRIVVISDSDRLAAGRYALETYSPDVFVLDDGFQHRKLQRDLDLVCVDSVEPFGRGELLPSGRLREPVSNLNRATAVVITRADLLTEERLLSLEGTLRENAPDALIFRAGASLGFESEPKGVVFAFCGLANGPRFYDQLVRRGLNVADTHSFPDHHRYDMRDLEMVEEKARSCGATAIVTTEKDRTKFLSHSFGMTLHVARLTFAVENLDKFTDMIDAAVARHT